MSGSVAFENAHPILRVEDMYRALDFYVGKLEFENASWGSEWFTCITRDRAVIYLSRGEQGRGAAWVWVGVEDAQVLHDQFKARGVKILMPPTNHSWALEFQAEDPDGNVLRFGSGLSPRRGTRFHAIAILASDDRMRTRYRLPDRH